MGGGEKRRIAKGPRIIEGQKIIQAIREMCVQANVNLPEDVRRALKHHTEEEDNPCARDILDMIQHNVEVASSERIAMCQDTGMAVVFLEIGQETQITGGHIEDIVNEGVRQGYETGFLRKSVVDDPIHRINTKDNTPAVIHYEIVPGDTLKITVAPKGFGSENMSQLFMLKPSDGLDGIEKAVIETVKSAGPNPCPPIVVGVGIGGTFEKAAFLAKKALIRDLGTEHPDKTYSEIEGNLLEKINGLGIGPQGFGGKTTALGLHIESYPTHIAGLPVAVNIGCHASRHVSCEL
jgi:fumarate hydratase subunit alpha